MFTPKHVFGFKATHKQNCSPSLMSKIKIDDQMTIKVLKWEIRDFEIENLDLPDGWFTTYQIQLTNQVFNLQQAQSSFSLSSEQLQINELAVPKRKPVKHTGKWPKWHKCDRYWPTYLKEKFIFLNQFYYNETVAYLFSYISPTDGEVIYAIYSDELDRQDAEEHYQLENKMDN